MQNFKLVDFVVQSVKLRFMQRRLLEYTSTIQVLTFGFSILTKFESFFCGNTVKRLELWFCISGVIPYCPPLFRFDFSVTVFAFLGLIALAFDMEPFYFIVVLRPFQLLRCVFIFFSNIIAHMYIWYDHALYFLF